MINPGVANVVAAKSGPAYSSVDKLASWVTVAGFILACVILCRRKGWL